MKKLRKGDSVVVIAGKYKGTISRIQSFVSPNYVIVEGVNQVKKAQKGKGFVVKHLPIHVSNVMYYDTQKKIASRVGIGFDGDKKYRICKKTGEKI